MDEFAGFGIVKNPDGTTWFGRRGVGARRATIWE